MISRPLKREEPDDPKSAADIKREYCYDYLYSPSVGAVTKNGYKNFGNCRYCWVIRVLDNLVPVCSNRCQVKIILLHLQNSPLHRYLNEEVPQTFLLAVNTKPCYINQHYARYYCTVNCFASQHITSQQPDVHLLIILSSKDENLLVAAAAINTVIMKWCK
jgi:hypothetical protein